MDIRQCWKRAGLFLETHQQQFWRVLMQILSLVGLSHFVGSVSKDVGVICSLNLGDSFPVNQVVTELKALGQRMKLHVWSLPRVGINPQRCPHEGAYRRLGAGSGHAAGLSVHYPLLQWAAEGWWHLLSFPQPFSEEFWGSSCFMLTWCPELAYIVQVGAWEQWPGLCLCYSESWKSPIRKRCGCDVVARYLPSLSLILEVRTCSHLSFPGLSYSMWRPLHKISLLLGESWY